MEKEYRKMYYRLLLIPPMLINRRKGFLPDRWMCPFARIKKNRARSQLEEIIAHIYARPFLQQEILIVYRDEALTES